jgi:hypothetical protein
MYGAREVAFRSEEETRADRGDLLMASPFDGGPDTSDLDRQR